ncbi:MAG: electron transfer flavoprotein subunit alpha/FixB family protein [Rhodocyclaceae bacterium]|nr:electron transfer flavoprotein subunit alpha/FixB family protein [Rhodocyclaceae bacterium]
MTVLVIAEHDNNELKPGVAQAVTAAGLAGGETHVLVAGANCSAAAAAAARLQGVARVLLCEATHYADGGAENLAALLATLAPGYSHLLAAATPFGKNLMPRLGALIDVAPISEIVAVEGPSSFVRPIYAGNVLVKVDSTDAIKVLTVRATAFAAAGDGGAAGIEAVPAAPDLAVSRVIGREIVKSERPELTAARVVVSGGRGMGSGENYHKVLEPLADRLGAALGASRAAVDAGFAPNDYQVGQTGKIVAPELYVAVGISGAIQHLAGMKDSKVIVAINKDPDAPIHQVADYGLVGDLFEAVPALVKELGG